MTVEIPDGNRVRRCFHTAGNGPAQERIKPIDRGWTDAANRAVRDGVSDFWHECASLRPRLLRTATRYADAAEAEDVVHEAFLRAAAHANLDRNRLRQFLTSVIKRLCVDEHRRRNAARRIERHPGHVPPHRFDPTEAVDDREHARWLVNRIGRLTDRERFVLQRLAIGVAHERIATELGTTRRATECLASRARSRARAALAGAVSA